MSDSCIIRSACPADLAAFPLIERAAAAQERFDTGVTHLRFRVVK